VDEATNQVGILPFLGDGGVVAMYLHEVLVPLGLGVVFGVAGVTVIMVRY
jgi:hypothetical protein